ncbi:MAG: acylphosphatase [Marinoscillum sp.]|uniref:acylphosphatase n=1 Tax=Marinoscillum sp. TaxID=2024838 RepID=UPI0032F871C8
MALEIRCYGKVQGVFFRASTKNHADDLRLKGWVQNEVEGSVLIHAEGDAGKLAELIEWCKEGPQFAVVNRVESWEAPDEDYPSFEIRQR